MELLLKENTCKHRSSVQYPRKSVLMKEWREKNSLKYHRKFNLSGPMKFDIIIVTRE